MSSETLTPLFAEPSGWLAGMAGGGAFAIAVVCWFMLSNVDSRDHEMIGGKEAQRLWRVYSVLAATFISIGCALLYYALFARFGLGQSFRALESGKEKFIGWLLFGLGFVLLPGFMIEFALAKIRDDVGFTIHYEENVWKRYPEWKAIYQADMANRPAWDKFKFRFLKLGIWLTTYIIFSIYPVQLYWNRRKNLSPEARGWKKLRQFFQGAQLWVDIYVSVSLYVVVAIMLGLLLTDADFKAMSTILVAYILTVYIYLLFFYTVILDFSVSNARKRSFAIGLWGLVYIALLVVDVFGHRPPNDWPMAVDAYRTIAQPFNGLLPWYLLALGIYLGAVFFKDWLATTQLRKKFLEIQLGELLLKSSNVDMTARLVHRVSNRAQAALGAFGAIRPELNELSISSGNPRWGLLGQQAQVGLNSLLGLKNELEDFKKGTRLQHENRWLDVGAIIREIAGEIGLPENSIKAQQGVQILAHPLDYPETLRNLLVNAKYEAQKAATPQITIHMFKTSGKDYPLRIEICDNGNGFKADIRDRLFLPYFSTKAEGSGLGLFLASSFMQNMQGIISAESLAAGDDLKGAPRWANTRFILDFPDSRIKFIGT